MPIGATEFSADSRQPSRVMTDVEFIADAHAAVQLYGFVADQAARGVSHALERGEQSSALWTGATFEGVDRQFQQRIELTGCDVHICTAVLQRLKGGQRHAKLLARHQITESGGIGRMNHAGRLGTQTQQAAFECLIQHGLCRCRELE